MSCIVHSIKILTWVGINMITDLKETKENKIVTNMSDVENEVKSSKEETIFQIQSFVAEGKFKHADELVKKSLAENYNDPQMLSLSALVAVAMQDWVQAIARLHVVIKIQGNDTPPLPHLLLIRSYRCSGQLVEAMKAAELAVKTHANNEEIVNEAAIIAEDLGEWESALLALEVLKEMHEMDDRDVPTSLLTRLQTARSLSKIVNEEKGE